MGQMQPSQKHPDLHLWLESLLHQSVLLVPKVLFLSSHQFK